MRFLGALCNFSGGMRKWDFQRSGCACAGCGLQEGCANGARFSVHGIAGLGFRVCGRMGEWRVRVGFVVLRGLVFGFAGGMRKWRIGQ